VVLIFYFVRVLQNKSTPSKRSNNDHHNNNDHHRDYIFYTCFHPDNRLLLLLKQNKCRKKIKTKNNAEKKYFDQLMAPLA